MDTVLESRIAEPQEIPDGWVVMVGPQPFDRVVRLEGGPPQELPIGHVLAIGPPGANFGGLHARWEGC